MAESNCLGEEKAENDIAGEVEKTAPKEYFTLEVLRLVKEAQLQHGLRHDDYQRYRQYCARRIRRTRKALHFPQGTRHKVTPKKLTKELVKDARFLMLPLIDAERAWAYAMQLKSEANTEPRKRFHMISRLRKAVQHASTLDRLCNDSGLFDARTKLDVEAYSSWMKGLFDFELEDWRSAMDSFSKAKTIYEKLAEAVSDEEKELYQQRCSEISPNIRYCQYNVGDESAAEDLRQMRRQIGREDPLTARLDELIEKTHERQSSRLSEISWAGRTVPVKNEQVRTLLLNMEHYAAQLVDATSDEHKLSLYESMMKTLVEAQQILRDEYKDDPMFKSLVRGQPPSDDVIPNSVYLHTYIIYLRQTYTVERNLLMIDALHSSKPGDGKKNRPQDFARLYEIIVQNLYDIIHLPGFEEQAPLCKDVNSRILCYKAFKCYFIAQSYLSVKKYKEVLALYERVLDYAQQSLEAHKNNQHNSKSKEIEALEELLKTVNGSKYSVHASSILESHDVSEPASAAQSAVASSQPLEERLGEYLEDASLLTKRPNLTKIPPDFQPVPAKPLFFDLALNLVQFPSLEDKVEQKAQAGGITGYFKGWWFGSKK